MHHDTSGLHQSPIGLSKIEITTAPLIKTKPGAKRVGWYKNIRSWFSSEETKQGKSSISSILNHQTPTTIAFHHLFHYLRVAYVCNSLCVVIQVLMAWRWKRLVVAPRVVLTQWRVAGYERQVTSLCPHSWQPRMGSDRRPIGFWARSSEHWQNPRKTSMNLLPFSCSHI